MYRKIRRIFRQTKRFFIQFLLILCGLMIASVLILHNVVMYNGHNINSDIVINEQAGKAVVLDYDLSRSNANQIGERSLSVAKNSSVPETHALENSCQYPVLSPNEESIKRFVKHKRHTKCDTVILDLVSLGDDGILRINYSNIPANLNQTIKCMYRSFAGALKPNITTLGDFSDWIHFDNQTEKIYDDQIEVQCFEANDTTMNINDTIYRFAFAQIAERRNYTFTNASEDLLSIDIIVLDSTSLNMMRRHMSKTVKYLMEVMGAFHLEGYNKVADNSMVNLVPVLAGKRYGNQGQDWPSEYPLTKQMDLESVPFIWKDFIDKGCATMFNDDPMHFGRGLFHYPRNMTRGFRVRPTEYYFRPWHVYHRKYPAVNASQFCFGNEPYYRLQLNLVEQMLNRYKNKCHFSFSFFTDLPHDRPSNLEQMDDTLQQFLTRLHSNNALNHTVLIIMGDHGHRMGQIMFTFIGRIEERTPFFSAYFPEWFRRKHPETIRNLRANKNRLTSNYDVYQMLKDIINGKFNDKPDNRDKGISLFQAIPIDRTCHDANIPEHHCTCLMKDPLVKSNETLKSVARQVILNYTTDMLTHYPECKNITDIDLIDFDILTTSQMIQHGVRNFEPFYLDKLKIRYLIGEIEYIQIKYRLIPTQYEALIRLQHDKKRKKLFVNVEPLVVKQNLDSRRIQQDKFLPKFCTL